MKDVVTWLTQPYTATHTHLYSECVSNWVKHTETRSRPLIGCLWDAVARALKVCRRRLRHWLKLHLERNMKLDRKTKRTEVYRSDFLLEPEEWNLNRLMWIMFMRVILISAAFSSWHLVSSWHTSCRYLNCLVYIFMLIFWSLSIC